MSDQIITQSPSDKHSFDQQLANANINEVPTQPLEEKESEEYKQLGKMSPVKTLINLAYQQLIGFIVMSISMIIMPYMATKAMPTKKEAVMSAFSASGIFEFISQIFGWFFSVGVSATISKFMGMKQVEKCQRLLTQMIVLGILLAILIAVVFIPLLETILKAMVSDNQGAEVIQLAKQYSLPYLIGAVFIILGQGSLGIFMGLGKMNYYLLLFGVQLILSVACLMPIFLFCTNLGIRSNSLGYVIAYIPVVIASFILIQKQTPIKLNFKLFDFHWVEMKEAAQIGFIDFISSASGILIMATVQSTVNKVGLRFSEEIGGDDAQQKKTYEIVLSSWSCLQRIYQIMIGLCYNTTGSYLTAASYAIGQRRYLRFHQLSVMICFVVTFISTIGGLLFIGIARPFASIFGNSPLYLKLTAHIVRIMNITCEILPIQFIVTTFCQATRKIWQGITTALITQIVMLPALFVMMYAITKNLDKYQNYYWCIFAFNLNDIISGLISLIVIYFVFRQYQKEQGFHVTFRQGFLSSDSENEVKKTELIV